MKGYKGDIVYAPLPGRLETLEDGYIFVGDDGLVKGVFPVIPEKYAGADIISYSGRLIMPAFADLHLHASQLPNRGLGYDEDFATWLSQYTYPAEHRYDDPEVAGRINARLIDELWQNGITRAVIMSSTSFTATSDLIGQFVKSGLGAYIGKMNSDYGAFGEPNESTKTSEKETLRLVELFGGMRGKVQYILSPEFIPCCSDEMLTFLGNLAKERGLPVQSHLAESPGDVEMVSKRCPADRDYASAYRRFGLFGQTPTVMAHCLYLTEEELHMMKQLRVYAAHCPHSNLNMPSGRHLPVKKLLEMGVPVGLGSDVAGGHTLSVISNMVAALQISKQLALDSPTLRPLTTAEVFYTATRGGGSFFGKVGSFEQSFAFDALVIDDSPLDDFTRRSVAQRLERFIYCGDSRHITQRYCGGVPVSKPS